MPDSLLGGQGATLLTAIIIVAVALLALVGVFWLIRNRAASTFIRGGKNRQPRLAVLDATAVDTRRRLVLIRRDDVEHLVMIGGPTDIVIESRIAPQSDLQTAPAARPREQHAPQQTAHEAPRPDRAAMPTQPVPQPVERAARAPEKAPQPRQQRPASPTEAAMAPLGAATTSRTEAADLLETARNRVFEEPAFDDGELDDLQSAADPATAPSPMTASTRPVRQQPRAQSLQQSPAPAGSGATTAAAADPIQAEAADVLDTVRTRVFEEPSFDESAFDELTSERATSETTRPAPAASPATSTATTTASAATGSGMATSRPVATAAQPPASDQANAASSDFETVLAAELSQDLTLEPAQDSFITAQYSEHQLDPEEAERLEAPEVQPETEASNDSLEAEMERLLGDLSRKP